MNLKRRSTKLSVKPQQLLLPNKNGKTLCVAYALLEINGNNDEGFFLVENFLMIRVLFCRFLVICLATTETLFLCLLGWLEEPHRVRIWPSRIRGYFSKLFGYMYVLIILNAHSQDCVESKFQITRKVYFQIHKIKLGYNIFKIAKNF